MNILYDERLDGALPKVDKAALLAELRAALPDLEILHEAEDLRPYECDGLSAYRSTPMLVVLPEHVEQVQSLLRLCHRMQVPVVARGAGTGLSGGALPLEQGVLLVMARFKRILEVNPEGRYARVQPGVRNLAISLAAAPHGLYYAPDPSSQIACSIGGNVAENAGGVHCLKYGLTVHNLLKVEVLTVDGERLTLGSDALDSPGFDLLALFTGSEGMLGVVVEVTVKLLPKPQVAKVLMASFDDVEKAGRAVGDIIAEGIIPGGLEMMDNLAIRAAEDFIHAGYPVEAEAILLCELDGVEADVADDCERVREVLEKAGATEVRLARDEAPGRCAAATLAGTGGSPPVPDSDADGVACDSGSGASPHAPRSGTTPADTPAPSAFRRSLCRHAASSRRYATRCAVDSCSHASSCCWSSADHPPPSRLASQAEAISSICLLLAMAISMFGVRRRALPRAMRVATAVKIFRDQPHALGDLLFHCLLADTHAQCHFLLR